jgi:hypothetical protein
MRNTCPAGTCNRLAVWRIVEAAESEPERKRLNSLADKLVASDQKISAVIADKRDAAERRNYADRYETHLLERHMNPEGVRASGTNNTTLMVNGWFCSRQFIYDLVKDAGEEARRLGFVKLECQSSLTRWWQEL